MPRQKEITARQKATALTKIYLKNNCNQAATARELGISRVAVNNRIHKKPVQDILQKFLSSRSLKKALLAQAKLGLSAEDSIGAAILVSKDGKVIKADDEGGIMVPDHKTRHKYWHDLMVGAGAIKNNGVGNTVSVINITYAYRNKPTDSAVRNP